MRMTADRRARLLRVESPSCSTQRAIDCQQAAEKVLKAFLIFHDRDPERTHDVERLLELAIAFDQGLAAFRSAAQRLTPLATLYR